MKGYRFTIFAGAIVLLLLSLPLSYLYVKEYRYDKKMEQRHSITKLTDATANEWYGHHIAIKEVVSHNTTENDRNVFQIAQATIMLTIDNVIEETLTDYNIPSTDIGMARYHNSIAFLQVDDTYIALVNRTENKYDFKQNLADYEYYYYQFLADGSVQQKSFTLRERNTFETLLLNNSELGLSHIGYYSNINTQCPHIIMPVIFPFGTMVVAIILLLYYNPLRKPYRA